MKRCRSPKRKKIPKKRKTKNSKKTRTRKYTRNRTRRRGGAAVVPVPVASAPPVDQVKEESAQDKPMISPPFASPSYPGYVPEYPPALVHAQPVQGAGGEPVFSDEQRIKKVLRDHRHTINDLEVEVRRLKKYIEREIDKEAIKILFLREGWKLEEVEKVLQSQEVKESPHLELEDGVTAIVSGGWRKVDETISDLRTEAETGYSSSRIAEIQRIYSN